MNLALRNLPAPDFPEIIDRAQLDRDLDAIVSAHSDRKQRDAAIKQRLKEELARGRETARLWLAENAHGRLCAQHISLQMDEVIRALHGYVLRHVHPARENAAASERLAVIAVGGYGRGLLAPGSDIDLLFLSPNDTTAWGHAVVEAMLYVLWDLGLKIGHSVRGLDECIRQSRADITIRTSVLEARAICGDMELADVLAVRFDKEIVQGTELEFVSAKLAERDERYRRTETSRYVVEPNVKEGKGGLRDLHTLFWIAKYVYRVREVNDLVAAGLYSRSELAMFLKAEDFLWAVRCHLHFVTGRAEDRLSFDLQPEIASRLGYQVHPGLSPVERFMKHYFLVAKNVGDLTAIVCAALEQRHAKKPAKLDRLLRPWKHPKPKQLETPDFMVAGDRLTVKDAEVFERDPVNLLRIFHIADRHDLALHPDASRLITRSLKLVDRRLREDREANRLFLEILTSHNAPETVLRRMNETGVLGRFIPEFGKVVGMMQFNMYHHYTVDEHLIRSVGVLAEMESGHLSEEHPLANSVLPEITSRTLLYVAVLMHDVAKGRPEDHSIAGARVMRKVGPRLGLSAADTETAAWLIENHLLMSNTAQSRDTSDSGTVQAFAAKVQTLERLKMLLVLTVADVKAVGPGVWTAWKGQLLRTLYWEAELVLAGGHSTANRSERVAAAKGATRAALPDWSDDEYEAYAGRHYPPYWLKVEPERRVAHARFLKQAAAAERWLATEFTTHAAHGVTEITVLAQDHPRLLAVIAGACAATGANIVDAYINTTTDGMALDSIFIDRAFADEEDERRRAARVAKTIEQALRGDVWLTDAMQKKAEQRHRRTRAFDVEPQVIVANEWSNRYTVIEVSGLDRPGLLYELTAGVARLNLNIASAHIVTFGEKAVDVFYVTDLTGSKITSLDRQEAIRKTLIEVLDTPTAKPAAVPVNA
ncbi:[protein-PII] uridylyltransferase [Terrihabitans rhizophilus]|uniref:Bifunctional uridylyltransferase/uridylyl-removing enzyme n=1 Tax=Terrihabitans rhizophilus TaxID=3092662 RepID=A0ABU4RKQ5_9HYPH|nr:[protein-PII] uridylyltransferase [Terrihabitans sp. PJ23]MDX6804654.1 [protein-PII] uridylyltransferase [Terrihabitans sp. PJ23]